MKRFLPLFLIVFSISLSACAGAEPVVDQAVVEEPVMEEVVVEEMDVDAPAVSEIEEDSADAPAVEEVVTEEVPEEPDTLRIIMVGDILLHTGVSDSARLEDGTYDYNPIFEHTSDLIGSADLALVNEEVIIGGEELGVSGYPSFNAPYEIGDALVENGFDVILHATNHALDRGKKGLVNCMDFWESNYPDIAVLGIHDSEEDRDDIFYYEQNGIKIAILNYTYGTNGVPLPNDMPWSVDLLNNRDRIAEDLKKAEDEADFTIVCPHWGTEYNLGKSAEQEKWAKLFVQNGADLIIGTHPHVIEPIEWYEDEETQNRALIYYSIGNFVNWTSGRGPGSGNRMVGGMADVTLIKEDAGVSIAEDHIHALVCHLKSGTGNVTVYPLADYSEELASENEMVLQDRNFSYDYCVSLCDEIWDKWE